MNVLALSSSPRRDGNSRLLADALLEGVEAAGHHGELAFVDDYVTAFLRDCRICRGADGRCRIEDGFETLLFERLLPADAVVFATPLYWYGVSGQLKTFLDRIFCYIAASYPGAEEVVTGLSHKRLVLLISSEENYVGASLGVLHEIQEYARYTHSSLVGVVNGIGNKRGDVNADPDRPLDRVRTIGRRLFELTSTDYRIDTDRPGTVWGAAP